MKAIALMSDGIDSPVAVYLMAKKGVEMICLNGKNSPEGDLEKPATLVRQIRKVTEANLKLFSFDHHVCQEAIYSTKPKWLHCVLCKRMMVRVASSMGKEKGAECIIMGDSLGQVASQTLANINVVESASVLPIIRPLIGLDKREIEDIGREAGTYEISIVGQKVCPFVPDGASIRGNKKEIDRLEGKIDLSGLVSSSLKNAVEIPL
jgi:thiamine biosynthesis protein ThiI